MENDYERTPGFMRFIFKGLNLIAWTVLGIIAIGVAIAYVTDHDIAIIHNENPPAASTVAPAAPTTVEKSGG